MRAMTLEFGPGRSPRGFQADKTGRALQAEAAGCARAGWSRKEGGEWRSSAWPTLNAG